MNCEICGKPDAEFRCLKSEIMPTQPTRDPIVLYLPFFFCESHWLDWENQTEETSKKVDEDQQTAYWNWITDTERIS